MENGDSIAISECNFMLTDIMAWHDNFYGEGTSPKILGPDASMFTIYLYNYPRSINMVSFMLGADSSMVMKNLINPGPMDQNGENFWSKDSGYTHYKLSGVLLNGGANKKLTYRIGGYKFPFNTTTRFVFQLPEVQTSGDLVSIIHLRVDVSEFFKTPHVIDVKAIDKCLGPGETAFKFAENYSDMFRFDHVDP